MIYVRLFSALRVMSRGPMSPRARTARARVEDLAVPLLLLLLPALPGATGPQARRPELSIILPLNLGLRKSLNLSLNLRLLLAERPREFRPEPKVKLKSKP